LQGLASGKPKAGLVPTVILSFWPEESKAQNDLSFMQGGNGKSWARKEQRPAVEVPAMRPAILRTASEAFRR